LSISSIAHQVGGVELPDPVVVAPGLQGALAGVIDPRKRRGVRHGGATRASAATLYTLRQLRKPIFAAVNGIAYGGGCGRSPGAAAAIAPWSCPCAGAGRSNFTVPAHDGSLEVGGAMRCATSSSSP
jgi:hypothetical protein